MKNGLLVVFAVAWLAWPITSSLAETPALSETHTKADQGVAEVQYNLGLMHAQGQGVAQDYVQAVQWYRKAADQGAAQGQFSLGVAYVKGQGVTQDYAQAYMWFSLAAAQVPGYRPQECRDALDALARQITPSQRDEAKRMAREWKPVTASPPQP